MEDLTDAEWSKKYLSGEKVAAPGECIECGELKKIVARGLCMRCYQRMRRAGEVGNYRPAALKSESWRRNAAVALIENYEDEVRDVLLEFNLVAVNWDEWKEFSEWQQHRYRS